MRLFSEPENKILKELVDVKSRGIDAIQHLQAARILREQFDFFALKWNVGKEPSVSIYYRHTDNFVKEESSKLYFKVSDFIYFLKELESNGFIAIQTITKRQERKYSLLFDRKKYKYNEESNEFIPINEHPIDSNEFIKGEQLPLEEVSPGIYTLLQVDRHEINLDFANDLERYGLGIIYPLPFAEDYVNHEFQTLEQRQFKQQMNTALESAKYSRWAAYLGGVSAFAAICTLFYTLAVDNKPTTIDRLDLERIETAIKANHVSEPFEIITNDTLLVKTVQPTYNKK
ncbi:MAG: hypothetical protein NC453_30105 [Muribaculum sp.]|nr:hypothetical protein [Muribaculum sp.]